MAQCNGIHGAQKERKCCLLAGETAVCSQSETLKEKEMSYFVFYFSDIIYDNTYIMHIT